jgi:LAS superfamily LD-carboxypeptidase LdcB
MNTKILTGMTDEHVLEFENSGRFMHKDVISAFKQLQLQAKEEIQADIQIVSCFRNFARQLAGWNAKAQGKRPLLDDQDNELPYQDMSPTEILYAILRWSAVPGASRHHWGTDVDIYDANEMKCEEVQLVPSECIPEGPFGKLHQWLNMKMDTKEAFDFFRPYENERGGVGQEKWHLSYAPIAQEYYNHYSIDLFKAHLQAIEIELKDILITNCEEVYEKYVMNIDLP